jgi:hypothetical protein
MNSVPPERFDYPITLSADQGGRKAYNVYSSISNNDSISKAYELAIIDNCYQFSL